jgi:phosphoglycolate phosphatase-like HAD superfamily hydrolase
VDELGVDPSPEVWYVGDTTNDGAAARAAGLSFAWASYGYGSGEPADADAVIRVFPEVVGL